MNQSQICYRKHLLKDKQYFFQCDQQLLISEYQDLKNPKYLLPLDYTTVIHFKVQNQKRVAFGLIYKGTLKWFYYDMAEKLFNQLRFSVFFGSVQQVYQSVKEIGCGVSSKVYVVLHRVEQKKYASKCIQKSYIYKKKNNDRYNRLIQEIEMLKQLQHPNIVHLVDIYQGDKSYYIITDLLEGPTVYEYNHDQCLEQREIKIFLKKVLGALAYIHSLGVIHRDIKLENLVLGQNGIISTVCIIDFGLASYQDKSKKAICGTPGYIAPEMFTGPTYDCKVDIFSLGCVLYKMINRISLFQGKNQEEILRNNSRYQNLSDSVVGSLEQLMSLMLMKNPYERISAKEALMHEFFQDNDMDEKSNEKQIYQFSAFNSFDNLKLDVLRSGNVSLEQQSSGYMPSFCTSMDHVLE